jgi:hypothetical protein
MSENDVSEKMSIEHSGDHHLAKATVDPKTGEVSAGIISNFSENATAGLQMVQGRVEGTFVHSGDNHALRIDAKSDGSYAGTYSDAAGKVEVRFGGNAATLVKGEIPTAGIVVNGDNHRTSLSMGPDGKLSGCMESTAIKNSGFKLELKDGKPSGSFIHKGNGHQTEIGVGPDGIRAAVSAGALSFSVEKGKAKATAFGNLKFKF